jgi:hypothetical protein
VRDSRVSGATGFVGSASYSASFLLAAFADGGVTTGGAGVSCVAVTSPSAFHSSGCP